MNEILFFVHGKNKVMVFGEAVSTLSRSGADLGEGPDGPRPPLLVEYL